MIAERVETLPLLPGVLLKVMQMDPESDAYFDEMVTLAAQEPNLAVRLVRFANSAVSAPGRPVQTLYQAAMRLGTRECAHIATMLAVARVFEPQTESQRTLWRHSILVAYLARSISHRGGGQREEREQSYLAGLLHDIGRFVMFESAADDLQTVSEAACASPDELLETEKRLLGYDHSQLGGRICERWELPPLLIEVVRRHHEHVPSPDASSAVARELRIVRLADAIAMCVETTPEIVDLEETADVLRALAPAIRHTELGQYESLMRHLADHLPATIREATRTYEQVMGLAPGVADH